MNRSLRIYRLDGIEIDTSQVCLKRNGQEQHVRQKTFQVLIYLLEHRQRLVTKDELIEHIWQGMAVTDNTLEQCLAEIRKVIGDDSRQPRFIRTIPRTGYRFIAPVDEVAPDQLSDRPSLPVNLESNISGFSYDKTHSLVLKPGRWYGRRFAVILGVLLLAAVCVAAFYVLRRRSFASASPLNVTLGGETGKRAVAVMFFENESSSADIDWLREGLADMLITDLAQSKNLVVLSRQQLHVLLDRIGHKESEKIKLDEALDVANKSQAKVVILGSFSRLGEQIRIDVHLHDARDGQLLTAERLVVDKPAEILTQVDLLSLKLASHLGAPAQTEANASLTDVMTNNLEAYRYYSLGVEKAQAMRNPEAIGLLQKAIALDPQFAMAYARIGYAYAVNWNRIDEGKPYLEKAFELSGRLSEKDKLYIRGWYAIVNFDFTRAIQSFREIVARSPLEVEGYRSLGLLLQGEERYNEAIEVLKQGLIIDPEAKDLYNRLGAIYSDLGRHEEAIAMYQRYVHLAPQEPNAHDSLAIGNEWAGRYEEAIEEYNRALALKPDFEIAIIHLGNTYFQMGRYRDAIKQYERCIQIAPSDLERTRAYNAIAHVERKMGKLDQAQREAMAAERLDKNAVDELFLLALDRRDLATAEKLKEELEKVQYYTRGSRGSQRKFLYHRGYFDLTAGRSEDAVRELKEALTHRAEEWNIDAYEDCLANAYRELGRFDEAIAEYERILKLNPNYPLVHYHLARAYEGKGQSAEARAEYQRFLQVWKNADSEIPEIVTAHRALSQI
jgi:tetratricopeptide (TPR) repeat protein/DNA-binding winged helix-turn-helix (wHTH) protein